MQVLWSRMIAAAPRGLSLARERGCILVWDANRGLHLFDRFGERQAHGQTPDLLIDACCSDDGRSFATVGENGHVRLLAPDLAPRWERPLPQRGGGAVAIDPFGQYVAAADGGGGLTLFDQKGGVRWTVANPRPLRHVAFIPERPALVAAADYGWVVCYDMAGTSRWRDGPLAHVGSLAVSGDGATLALACFSDGLQCYSLDGPKRRAVAVAGACRLAAVSYDGDLFLTADLEHRLHLADAGGGRGEWNPDCAPVALALGATGEDAVVALADGRVVALRTA